MKTGTQKRKAAVMESEGDSNHVSQEILHVLSIQAGEYDVGSLVVHPKDLNLKN